MSEHSVENESEIRLFRECRFVLRSFEFAFEQLSDEFGEHRFIIVKSVSWILTDETNRSVRVAVKNELRTVITVQGVGLECEIIGPALVGSIVKCDL
jgi:hypothetical protein